MPPKTPPATVPAGGPSEPEELLLSVADGIEADGSPPAPPAKSLSGSLVVDGSQEVEEETVFKVAVALLESEDPKPDDAKEVLDNELLGDKLVAVAEATGEEVELVLRSEVSEVDRARLELAQPFFCK